MSYFPIFIQRGEVEFLTSFTPCYWFPFLAVHIPKVSQKETIPSKFHPLEVQLLFPDTQTVPKPRRILRDAFHFPREGKPPLLVICHHRRYHGPESIQCPTT